MNFLSSLMMRRSFAISLTLLLAVWLSYYLKSESGWLVLSAFLISQAQFGAKLRQALIYFLSIIFAMLMVFCLAHIFGQSSVFNFIIVLWLFIHFIFFKAHFRSSNQFYFMLSFFAACLFAGLVQEVALGSQMMDIILGALLGILCGQFIFPASFPQAFKEGILPTLNILSDCMQQFVREFANFHETEICKIEKKIQGSPSTYPEWAYEAGFNPGLRSGFRFFLINLERIMDLFSSLDYLTREAIPNKMLYPIAREIADAMEKNNELVEMLIHYFKGEPWKVGQSDFTSDISALEIALQKIVPSNLELLDISPDNVILIAIARDIKDMRQLLLQLVSALPAA